MADINVSTSAEFLSALSSSAPGDDILLAPGIVYDTGGDKTYVKTGRVTVKSADPDNQAEIGGGFRLVDSAFLRLENIFFNEPSFGDAAVALRIKNSDDMQVYNCRIEGGKTGAQFFGGNNLEVVGNFFDNHRVDHVKFAGVTNFLIENNHGGGHMSPNPAPDDHMDFIQFQGDGTDGVIRGNTFFVKTTQSPVDGSGKIHQGIFLNDGDFTRIVIEDNLIYTTASNAIYVRNATDITIRRNTILEIQGATQSPQIRLVDPIGGNVVEPNNVGSHGSSELVLQHDNPAGANYYNDVYQNATVGLAAVIEDFRPVPGGPADFGSGMGAERRIAELLDENGGSIPSMSFTYSIETAVDPAVGALVIDDPATGDMTFTPVADVVGNTSFQYRKASDIFGNHAIGTIQVNVVPPTVIAPDGNLSVDANTPKSFNVESVS